jgi:hypothetical protein
MKYILLYNSPSKDFSLRYLASDSSGFIKIFVIFWPSYQLLGFLDGIYFILSATAVKAMGNIA